MKQINIFCEGRTEQGFCAQVLQPHLFPNNDGLIHTLAVGNKDHHHVFGLGAKRKYGGDKGVRKFICNAIKQKHGENVYFTTLFDLYALPSDFPGKASNSRNKSNPTPYVLALEKAFSDDIGHHRFIPNLILHEFETLLFADPEQFAAAFDHCDGAIEDLKQIAASEASIELIDDGANTAPSKRIINAIPEYKGQKIAPSKGVARLPILDPAPRIPVHIPQTDVPAPRRPPAP